MTRSAGHNDPWPTLNRQGCRFTVWAPEEHSMTVHLLSRGRADTRTAMQKAAEGYFTVEVEGAAAGDRYYYITGDGRQHPDPCSHYQPEGVFGPSQIIDHDRYSWQDAAWRGLALSSLIFYEIHVGSFTPEGSFEAIIPRLDELAMTGINALELMPVAECPGNRNWGYDGVFLYAAQHNYGGPDGLKRLVDACHRRGIAVFLDVVYNHVGKEGNCLEAFGPYFSSTYHTPWGKALNFDGAWSDGVKAFVVGNLLHWARHYHLDGLRLDAVHEIYDRNAITIWDDMHTAVDSWRLESGRPFYLIAESDTNDPRTVRTAASGGKGLDAQWLDDFHHILYVLLDREGRRHYQDYTELQQLAKAYTEGFVYSGEYVAFRHRRHGAASSGLPGSRFVVFNQNHDLPGNRPGGERISMLVDFERQKLAAAAVLLSPYLPLLFMGEEYGEKTPFYFFSDYSQPQTATELRDDRKRQFAGFGWDTEAPDPQQETSFLNCILKWDRRTKGQHRQLLEWHRRLITLRKTHPLLADLSRQYMRADLLGSTGLAICRHSPDRRHWLITLFNFAPHELNAVIPYTTPPLSLMTPGISGPVAPGISGPVAPGTSGSIATGNSGPITPGNSAPLSSGNGGPAVWTRLLASTDGSWAEKSPNARKLPDTLASGQSISLPPWTATVYELNASPEWGSP